VVNPALIMDRRTWVPCMPLPCPTALSEKVKFRQVSCGAYHTVAVSEDGDVYACGLVTRGRLGLTEEQARQSMTAAEAFRPKAADGKPLINLYELVKVPLPMELQGPNRVVNSAHCGYDYTLLLTMTGQVLSAGNGQHGIHCNFQETPQMESSPSGGEQRQGGGLLHDTQKSLQDEARAHDRHQFALIPLDFFGGHIVTFLSAGERHAAIINMNGELWTWGLNSHGQCGVKIENNPYAPDRLSMPVQPLLVNDIDQKATLVACGGKHTLAITSENGVFAWGSNSYGQLGLSLDELESFDTPREVYYFKEKIVSWLSAGSNHSLALTIEGYAYLWGRNDHGQLGLSQQLAVKSDSRMLCPKVLETVLGVGIAQASCNFN